MPKHVAILLGTFNGEKFLAEQLDSIFNQTHKFWKLYVSDDGSDDRTLVILNNYAEKWGANRIQIFTGLKQGLAQNYRHLIQNNEIQADYFAFCDQDDVWHIDKIEKAVVWLQTQDENVPALYCNRLNLINAKGEPIGISRNNPRRPSFRNALVENVSSGNTIMINRSARNLLARALTASIIIHDWSSYILVSAMGGAVYFDPVPHIDYRQHDHNIIGVPTGMSALRLRINRLLDGTIAHWNAQHIELLAPLAAELPPQQAKTFRHFQQMYGKNGLVQIFHLFMAGLYRQTFSGQCGLWLAALLAKT
jgi:glycosyltransferase involved in cell wall biosynthesis